MSPSTVNADVQRTLSRSLMGGSVLFLALLLAVVWAVAVPHGPYAPRRIAPVLELAVARAAAGNALAVHGLYSSAGLRATSLDDVDALLFGNEVFAGATGVRIDRITPIDGLDALAPQAAIVNAFVRYGDGRPSYPLTATLDYEESTWRIRSLDIGTGRVPEPESSGGAP